MKFYDEVNVNDSLGLNGYVIIKDNKTGKILLEKHNMILAGAKKVLLSKLLFKKEDANSSPECSYIEMDQNIKSELKELFTYELSECRFYNNLNSEVVYEEGLIPTEETFLSIKINNEESIKEDYDANTAITSSSIMNLELIEGGHYRIKINITFNSENENPIEFTSLGLIMKDSSKDTNSSENIPIPFSRIKFDPIILTQESSLNLTYYVYF